MIQGEQLNASLFSLENNFVKSIAEKKVLKAMAFNYKSKALERETCFVLFCFNLQSLA